MPARISPAFFVLRGLLIHKMAGAGTPTADIAKAFGINRSYVIRQTTVELKPRTPAERRILKHATEHQGSITRLGFGGLFRAEDITTILAGGERAKLGSLAERRAAKKINAKPAPKKESPAKRVLKLKRATPVEPVVTAPSKPPRVRVRVRKPRLNAAQKMVAENTAGADDILDAPPPPDMPL